MNAFGVGLAFGMFTVILLVPKLAQTPPEVGYGFGLDATGASVFLVPMALAMLVGASLAGVAAGRTGSKRIAVAACAAASIALFGLAAFRAEEWQVAVCTGLFGLGFSSMMTSVASLLAAAASPAQIGEANGVSTMLRAGAGALGAQVAATILTASTIAGTGYPTDGAYTAAFAVGGVVALLSLVASLLVPAVRPERAPAVAEAVP